MKEVLIEILKELKIIRRHLEDITKKKYNAGAGLIFEGGPAMTREEAVELLCYGDWLNVISEHIGKMDTERIAEAMSIVGKVLRPISRERVEQVWRGEWIGSADGYADGKLVYDTWTCSECGYVIDEEDDPDMLPQFCPKCYAAMTDEAVEMVMERLEALHHE